MKEITVGLAQGIAAQTVRGMIVRVIARKIVICSRFLVFHAEGRRVNRERVSIHTISFSKQYYSESRNSDQITKHGEQLRGLPNARSNKGRGVKRSALRNSEFLSYALEAVARALRGGLIH